MLRLQLDNPQKTDPGLVNVLGPLSFPYSFGEEKPAEEKKNASVCILFSFPLSSKVGHL